MSHWFCLSCGQRNRENAEICSKCFIDKVIATSKASFPKIRKTCIECNHKHREGEPCHVFTEAADISPEDATVLEDDTEEDSELSYGSDAANRYDKDVTGNVRSGQTFGDKLGVVDNASEAKPPALLKNPDYASAVHFTRCNCTVGMPSKSRRYIDIPKQRFIGDIRLVGYDSIMMELEETKQLAIKKSLVEIEIEKLKLEEEKAKKEKDIFGLIPHILQYLEIIECSPAIKASRFWRNGVANYRPYVDIRDCTPLQVIRPHTEGIVESALIIGDVVYTGSHHGIAASTMHGRGSLNDMPVDMVAHNPEFAGRARVLGSYAKDSGTVGFLKEHDNRLFAGSSNGAVRVFQLNYDPLLCLPVGSLIGHSRSVSDMIFEYPTMQPCSLHGISGHRCFIYTCSEDRTICVWDSETYQLIEKISSRVLRTFTFSALTLSMRHYFAGTTGSTVMVLSKENMCEREDSHLCSGTPLYSLKRRHCLQVTLELPPGAMGDGNEPHVTRLLFIPFQQQEREENDSSSHKTDGVNNVRPRTIALNERTSQPLKTENNFIAHNRRNLSLSSRETSIDQRLVDMNSLSDRAEKDDAEFSFEARLWAADSIGRITIWNVPKKGLEFTPVNSWFAHKKSTAVTDMACTHSHVISVGDDGVMQLFDKFSVLQIRQVNLLEWTLLRHVPVTGDRIKRRLKCLSIREDASSGGDLVIGTSYGDVFILPLGTHV